MLSISQIIEDVVNLFIHLFEPGTLATLIAFSTMMYRFFKSVRKAMERDQNQIIETLNERLTTLETTYMDSQARLEREILRVQLLQGMDSKRLSENEVLFFYDAYKKSNGNSFIDKKVEDYLQELKREREEVDH